MLIGCVAELVDAQDLRSCGLMLVWVRVPPCLLEIKNKKVLDFYIKMNYIIYVLTIGINMPNEVDEVVVDEVVEETVEQSNDALPEFDKKLAVAESRKFVADLLLHEPQTEEELFVATDVQMNEDGSIAIICVSEPDSETAIMHTIYSGYVDKHAKAPEDEDTKSEDEGDKLFSIPSSGKLVGLDGQPLT